MTRAELLALLQQAATAVAADDKPAQWTEEDRAMLKEVHAAVVTKSAQTVDPPKATPPIAAGLPEVAAPPSLSPEPKKKNFWQKLGGGMKTTLVAIGAGGGTAALNAVVDSVQHGNISPTGIATAALGAAVTGAIAYRAKSPVEPKE